MPVTYWEHPEIDTPFIAGSLSTEYQYLTAGMTQVGRNRYIDLMSAVTQGSAKDEAAYMPENQEPEFMMVDDA